MKMKVSFLVSISVLLVCGSIPLAAQPPVSFARLRGLLPGRAVADNAPAPGSTSATPNWSSGFKFIDPSVLEGHSAVYYQPTNTMIVFGGLSAALGFTDTNAVLLNAPATGSGLWSILIANGTAGAPPARDSHSAVYDSVNNRMIVFAGQVFSSGTSLNDVW